MHTQFDGYTPEQVYATVFGLWGEKSIVKIKKMSEEDLNAIPLFRQIRYVIDFLLREGKIKLTVTKSIPSKLVKELYELGVKEYFIERGVSKLTKEIDSLAVQLTHIMLKLMKVVKEQKGVMTLSKNGEKMAKDNQWLFEVLLSSFTNLYNFAYFDAYEDEQIAKLGCGYSLAMVGRYGNVKRSNIFYAGKYFSAFPDMKNYLDENVLVFGLQGASCYSVRTFDRFMLHFGLIDVEEVYSPEFETFITKTPLFDKVISVEAPDL